MTPVLFFSVMNLYIWVPIAALAVKERRIAGRKARALMLEPTPVRVFVPTTFVEPQVIEVEPGDLDYVPEQPLRPIPASVDAGMTVAGGGR